MHLLYTANSPHPAKEVWRMARGFCPECDAEVGLGKAPKLGQRVPCPRCGAFLEAVETSSIKLDWDLEDDEELDFDEEFLEEEY